MSVKRKRSAPRSLVAVMARAFLTLSLLVLLIASASLLLFNVQAQREIIASRQRLVAQEAANTVAGFVQEKFSVLEAAVRFSNPATASPEEQKTVLGHLLGLDPAIRQAVLLDAQAHELSRASRLSQAASGRIMERVGSGMFSLVRQGNRYVSPVYVDKVTSEPMVVMAVAAMDAFGEFRGVLLVEVNLKFMWDLVERLQVGESGVAYVVDRQGNLIAFGDTARVLRGENVAHLRKVKEFVTGAVPAGATSLYTGIDGNAIVGTYVPLGMPDWAVVTEVPILEAYRPIIRGAVIAVFLVVGMATLAALVGTSMARRLAAPLLDLTTVAGRIARGEIDVQAALAGPAEAVSLATAFNSMTAQLRDLISSLEQRVADRTRNLQAAAEVARATASVLNAEELLRQTVDLVRERFDLYYVGIFTLDEARQFAVLRAGTGEAGRKMLEQGHKLEVGGGSMIGQCVATGQARIALDVGAEAVRFDNPLLPKTRSEMALPLRSRGRVIGAMTVQSTKEAAFDEADIAVMQTMADQVAIALDNAHLLAETQAALEAERRAYSELSWQAWNELMRARTRWGYRYANRAITLVAGDWRPEMLKAVKTGRSVSSDGTGDSTLAVPIKIRDQVVGVLNLRKSGGEAWSDDEIALLETLSEQLGMALDSARLYQDTQRRAARERLAREITDRMRRATDVEKIVQAAVDELFGALGTSRAFVRLGVAPSPQEARKGSD